ncbi:unnamed protein product [Brachionus calyciflorus]|uniref:Cytochrome c oxidase assembly factor 7 n=1 Tax=Brachionus calyciflorus TaxID=104777 RepID=A0A814JRV4_9BILA|nr:unnamed protein product [Brachionus calyciflorus]
MSNKTTTSTSSDEQVVEKIRQKLSGVNEAEDKGVVYAKSQKVGSLDWKNPEEVQDYLENLYVEYSFQCLNEKIPEGCHRLANFFENIRSQYTEATKLYKKNCDDNKYGKSCLTYAKNKSLGRGCKKDLQEACTYSFLACDEYKLTEGCLNSGICLSEGVGGSVVNVKEATRYLNLACDDKNPYACLKLFKIYLEGAGNVEKNLPKAFEYTKRACDGNDLLGCLNASLMLRKGDGIEKNIKLAEEYRAKADEIRKETESHREHYPIVFGEQHQHHK